MSLRDKLDKAYAASEDNEKNSDYKQFVKNKDAVIQEEKPENITAKKVEEEVVVVEPKQKPQKETKTSIDFSSLSKEKPEIKSSSTASLDSKSIEIIVEIYEEWTKLDPTSKVVLNSILSIDKDSSPSKVIAKIHDTDKSQLRSITRLVELKQAEPVVRAFSLMELSYSDMQPLVGILEMLDQDGEIEESSSNAIAYAKAVEKRISNLRQDLISNLVPLRPVLEKGIEL